MAQRFLKQDFPTLIIILSILVALLGIGSGIMWPGTPEEPVKLTATAVWTGLILFFTLISLAVVGMDELRLGLRLAEDAKEWFNFVMLATVGTLLIFFSQIVLPQIPGKLTPVSIGPVIGFVLSTAVIPIILNAAYPATGETILFLGLLMVVTAKTVYKDTEFYDLWKKAGFWLIIICVTIFAGMYHHVVGGYGKLTIDEILSLNWLLPQTVNGQLILPSAFFAVIMFFIFSFFSFMPKPIGGSSILVGIICHFYWNLWVIFNLLHLNPIWYVAVLIGSFSLSIFFQIKLD